MRFLLDTHVALWVIKDHPRLAVEARDLIEHADECFVSAVSLWEISIKYARRSVSHDPITMNAAQAREAFRRAGFKELSMTHRHAVAMDDLPPVHADPFDRLLVAQAKSEPLILLTQDEALAGYGDGVRAV